ncbi:MAG TPA: efflux RND transporter periplasmic adaptor subunit [Verrucomicrobiae bacterium]|nr:efflux RND transporter periplasmic adaptor subunit [Verrucomicrobiae bacterium]
MRIFSRIVAHAFLITASLLLAACGRHSFVLPPPEVLVVPAERRDVTITKEWVGSLDGLVNAQIRAQAGGYLLSQDYQEGQSVHKGDLLFQIDPRTFQATYDQVKANYDKTEMDVKRYTPLAAQDAISRQELDDAVQSELQAKAQLESAQLNLDFTRITSPIDGIAGAATAQIGDLVGPSSGNLTTVSTVDPIKAYLYPSEQEYLHFIAQYPEKAGRLARVHTADFLLVLADGRLYPQGGQFYALDRQVDPQTGTIRLTVLFPNPDHILRPGQFARVRLHVVQPNALVVPQRSVSEVQGSYQVAVVDNDNKTFFHTVAVGERTGFWWVITDGLKTGDRVIVEGIQKVRDGTVVVPKAFVESSEVPSAPVGDAEVR